MGQAAIRSFAERKCRLASWRRHTHSWRMNEEITFWKGSPSQWLNIGHFAAALLLVAGILIGGVFFPPAFIALILPLGWIVWRYLVVRCQTFELTN